MMSSLSKRSHAETTANSSAIVENEKTGKKIEASALDQLKKFSVVVADTGDFNEIKSFSPQDATTNPTLIFQAIQKEEYRTLLEESINDAKKYIQENTMEGLEENEEVLIDEICDRLAVKFGIEILKVVPGVVSTEVNANLSFDIHGSVEKARKLIKLYEEQNFKRERILIKMAATWEGCKAAEILEKENIHVNMTLIFSLTQAICAADANATLISPFVGRIFDWYMKKRKEGENEEIDFAEYSEKDPGVLSVQKIYKYYKKFGYKTIIMGASFRNIGEIINLCGCDKLTISPKLLSELSNSTNDIRQILHEKMDFDENIKKIHIDEAAFRWQLNEDQMATEKLSEGIRNFNADLLKLKNLIKEKLNKEKE